MTRIFVMAAVAAMMTLAQPVKASTLEVAKKYIGMSESKNRKALRSMMGVDPRRTPWCGAFATFVVKKAGKRPPKGPNMARSWLRWGKPVKVSQARPGDIVVVRSVRNHVGVFSHRQGGKLCLVSGNSGNKVRVSCYARILGVRRG